MEHVRVRWVALDDRDFQMHITFFHATSLRYGFGEEKWVLETGRRLAEDGFDVTVVTTSSTITLEPMISREELASRLGDEVEHVELPFVTVPYSRSPIPLRLLGDFLERSDVMYFADGFAFQDLYVLLNRSLFKKPAIYGNHAPLHQSSLLHDTYTRQVTLRLLQYFDALLVRNSDNRDILSRYYTGDIFVIPNGIDTSLFAPREQRVRGDRFQVLFVGNLNEQKGVDLLPAIVGKLNARHSLKERLHFTICGDGEMRDMAGRLAGDNPNVEFAGYRTDVHRLYRESDLFLAPSRWETLGWTLVEAQSCGVPVVSSNIPGPRDVIQDERQGLLAGRDKVHDYVESVLHYYDIWENDYQRYLKISSACRENAVSRYSWREVLSQFESMLRKVVEGPSS